MANNYNRDLVEMDIEPRRKRAFERMLSLQYKLEGVGNHNIGKSILVNNELQFATGEFEALDELYHVLVERNNEVQKTVYVDKADIIQVKELSFNEYR